MAGTRFTSSRADARYRQGSIPYASNTAAITMGPRIDPRSKNVLYIPMAAPR